MQLISWEVISRHYTPIIRWLQEVDEQVRTDSDVKTSVFLQIMQNFNTYFYIEVLWMAFSIVENASAQLYSTQLNFAKPWIFLLAQKLLSLAQETMQHLTVYGMEF